MTTKKEILKTIFNKDFNIVNGLLELQMLDYTEEPVLDTIIEESREKNSIYNIFYHHNYNFLEELLLTILNNNHSDLIELINYEIITLLQYDLNILYNAYKTFNDIESLYVYFNNDKKIIKELQIDNLLFILDDIIILVDDTTPNKIYHC